MDAEVMMIADPTLHGLAFDGTRMLADLARPLAVGLVAGAVFYGGLWWTTQMLRQQKSWLKVGLLTLGRGGIMVAALGGLAQDGPRALVAATVGVMLARHGALLVIGGRR
jgi:F1F0 ATPase subunit 2